MAGPLIPLLALGAIALILRSSRSTRSLDSDFRVLKPASGGETKLAKGQSYLVGLRAMDSKLAAGRADAAVILEITETDGVVGDGVVSEIVEASSDAGRAVSVGSRLSVSADFVIAIPSDSASV